METLLERLLAIESVSAAVIARRDGAIISSTIDGEEAEALGAMGAAAALTSPPAKRCCARASASPAAAWRWPRR